ncbi:TatD family hydrolase [Rhodohalobacter sp. 614A]|uniref:TatD family hydrolase n=1 Tax=Rhodohalobacter sp. 614A TaxID=2908649 RepID=UPI001F37AA88
MIDAHTHIDQYGDDLPKALAQIRKFSIRTLAVSMDIPSYRKTQQIADEEPLIITSFGIHPWKAPEYADRLDELAEPLENAKAIGEIGLCHRFVDDESQYPAQRTIFNYFLDAAERTGKLINLHTSGAEAEILDGLAGRNLSAIIIHWYSGPPKLVRDFLDLGAYFTIGVEVLQSKKIQKLAKELPTNRILTETDNPSGWHWLNGETGFPNLIEPVEKKIAEIRGVSRAVLSENICLNFNRLMQAGGLSQK